MVVIAAFVVVLGFRVLEQGRHGSSQAKPQPPHAALSFAGYLWVGMGVRRQSRSPPMPPFF